MKCEGYILSQNNPDSPLFIGIQCSVILESWQLFGDANFGLDKKHPKESLILPPFTSCKH